MHGIHKLGPADAAADLHRVAGATIPDYDTSLHSAEEYLAFYRDDVLINSEVWGVFDRDKLCGFIALQPGWIDHLYVRLDLQRQGIGSQLMAVAKQSHTELRLYTFQSNTNARTFYERHGFVIEEMTDGARNEEKMPDLTYLWRTEADRTD